MLRLPPPARAHGVPWRALRRSYANAPWRRASSPGIGIPSGMSAASAASAFATGPAAAFNRASILPACSWESAPCRLALARIFVPPGPAAPLRHAHLASGQQQLNEQTLDLLGKPPPERRDRGVAGMIVGRDETKRRLCHMPPVPARGSKTRPPHNHESKCPAAFPDDAAPGRNHDNRRSSREDRARRSPPRRSAPNASPAATRPPAAATETRSAGPSRGSRSSAGARHHARINATNPSHAAAVR